MAQNINEMLQSIGFQNLGVEERKRLIVLNSTRMPAVLVEVGFINSDRDNTLLDSEFDAVAYAIADGITKTIYPQNY